MKLITQENINTMFIVKICLKNFILEAFFPSLINNKVSIKAIIPIIISEHIYLNRVNLMGAGLIVKGKNKKSQEKEKAGCFNCDFFMT